MDVTQLIAESGVSIGMLTLTSVVKAVLTLLVGLAVIRLVLTMTDRAFERTEKFSPLKRHIRPLIKPVWAWCWRWWCWTPSA